MIFFSCPHCFRGNTGFLCWKKKCSYCNGLGLRMPVGNRPPAPQGSGIRKFGELKNTCANPSDQNIFIRKG